MKFLDKDAFSPYAQFLNMGCCLSAFCNNDKAEEDAPREISYTVRTSPTPVLPANVIRIPLKAHYEYAANNKPMPVWSEN
ncbi:hypothetical protein FQR65_LT06528 [Abscondita terminalis]|nr:hypothetical protein FQR65_LT06528 [Abscondita terminalis]